MDKINYWVHSMHHKGPFVKVYYWAELNDETIYDNTFLALASKVDDKLTADCIARMKKIVSKTICT